MANFFNRDFMETFSVYNVESKIFILTIILLSTYLLFYIVKRKQKLPPGPVGLPVFGYLPFLGKAPFETVASLAKKYGPVLGMKLGQKYVVFLNNWDAVKEAFSKSETANRPPGIFDAMPSGVGFGALNGRDWSEQRKFTMKAMKDIGLGRTRWEELVQEEVDDLVKMIKKEDEKAIDVNHHLAPSFANNIMILVLGYRLPLGHQDLELVTRSVDSIMKTFPVISLENYLPWLGSFLRKAAIGSKSLLNDLIDFSQFVGKVIKEKSRKSQDESNDSFIDIFQKEIENKEKDNLSKSFTARNLQGNTQVLLVGGSETSRTSTIWLLLAIAQHQEIQRKVRNELYQVIGADGKITWADRTKIPYTYAVIMEAMRWRTVAPLGTLRITFEDIKIGGYDIPRGTVIINNIWALHNDPKYWPEPDKFIPERFLMNGGKQVNFKPDSFIPFSYGKRSCPGELIALMEVLLFFTTLIRNFEILPPEDGHLKYETHLGLSYQSRNLYLRFVPCK